ncbi:hypothetical protein TRAPUB_9663 [Trametes pubescens]|uniref:Uncharacterized protein n=1 Tax=Trametes pubescens TaxID=154538 RepID=A0A1M2W1Y0_TRAPU|nr:hypothetical protein TRAPUB_9663 [Trametes pubescens]
MASTTSALSQGSAALSQPTTSVPSPSTSRWSSLRRAIHVVIPSAQAAIARVATPTVTPIHGHPLTPAAASPAVLLSTLDTPTHGHGDVVAQTLHESPLTPTLPRMSARATRRSGLFSASSATDADVQMHSLAEAAHTGLMTPPMEEEEASHGDDEDEHSDSESAESSRATSAADESDEDVPRF